MQYASLDRARAKTTRRHPRAMFTADEDQRLKFLVSRYGTNWPLIADHLPDRNIRQCKDRWTNYLSPNLSFDPWTDSDDRLLMEKFSEFGAKWVRIAQFFPKRTDTALKSRWFILMRRARKGPDQSQTSPGSFDSHDIEALEVGLGHQMDPWEEFSDPLRSVVGGIRDPMQPHADFPGIADIRDAFRVDGVSLD
jgi:hypothetical protein